MDCFKCGISWARYMENLLLHVSGTNLSPMGQINVGEKVFQKMSPQSAQHITL
jgi:hypothetical protein